MQAKIGIGGVLGGGLSYTFDESQLKDINKTVDNACKLLNFKYVILLGTQKYKDRFYPLSA